MAMQGIASVLGGKQTTSLLNETKSKDQANALSFLQALQGQTELPAETAAAPSESPALKLQATDATGPSPELWDKFKEFVGNTLFGQTLASMRKTQEKPAYFHGGQTEEIFQQQLDQHLVEHITEASADRYIRPMFEHFEIARQAVDLRA